MSRQPRSQPGDPTKPIDAAAIAAVLGVPERVLLFCLASGTEWAPAGVAGATATAMLVRGLIDRDGAGKLRLTPPGRATALFADVK
jgi:hypothetical protein